ncbi:hypothetical protein DVA67_011925 [Solirubrobacter sp. CPCC 204708]|uniref:DUF4375 domain-containing protein n=1 Tax=Solirubrobacter deserti TaxID=2282478 RepID=A0ABT4RLQ5_9ACTN|nr:hypothetical protein [Solirubrobacter deserti]MBE2316685.1 hypothetical protein [Solirubrobacter deserti]MDA0139442.1 hypothetical protein [Solirubrobacter deserti]
MDTRLPAGTDFAGLDSHEVYFAVFDPLDERSPNGLWGFNERDFELMTKGQRAVFNLNWLRNYMEADTILEYADEPGLRAHAHRLVADAELVGAWPFTAVLAEIAPVVAQEQELPFDDSLLDEVERLEATFFALEDDHGALWHFLADYIRRTPEEFIQSEAATLWRRPADGAR